jgi:hypothetical protein
VSLDAILSLKGRSLFHRFCGRAFFQGLLEHAAVEGQLGDQGLEPAVLGFEFEYANLFI